LSITITATNFARLPIANFAANNFLAQYSSKITCLDLKLSAALTFDLTEAISKLCIQSPKANVELKNLALDWQLSIERFSPKLAFTKIKVEQLKVLGSALLIDHIDKNRQKNNQYKKEPFSFNDIKQSISQLAQLDLASKIQIQQIDYQPYIQDKTFEKPRYLGQLAIDKNKLVLSINPPKEATFLTVQLSVSKQSLHGELAVELSLLRELLAHHHVKLPADIDRSLSIKGQLTSQLQWQDQQKEQSLTINSQLNDFSLQWSNQNDLAIPFNINGILNWQTSFNDNMLQVNYSQQSKLDLVYQKEDLLKLLSLKDISPQLIELVKNNPKNHLSIEPHGKVKLDLEQKKLFVSELKLTSLNTNFPMKFALNNTTLKLENNEQTKAIILDQAEFSLATHIKVKQLNKISAQPIKIEASGRIKQNPKAWLIELAPTTKVQLSELHLSEAKLAATKDNKPNNTNLLNASKLLSHWQGDISINNAREVTLALQLSSQITKLVMPELMQVELAQLNATIDGNINDINLVGNVTVDELELAQLSIQGNVNQANLELYTKKISLTDLLGLNIKLPFSVQPIAGNLSYRLSGQLAELINGERTPLKLTVELQDLSGEFNDIWVEELNWQHHFILNKSDIQSDNSANDRNNNKLTIAQLGTEPALTNLSAQTNIDLKNNVFNLSATNISAGLLEGNIHIAQAQWPMSAEHSVNVQLNEIDLEQLLALDKKQGIVVTGKVSGLLPVVFANKKFTIKNGELHNVSNGLIQIVDNPAVERLKASSTELKLAFEALENLHYHQLTSEVSMADDGYMLLDTKIKGRNPDLDNEVNLNLNLSYDLLGLLESISITERFEKNIINKLQKN